VMSTASDLVCEFIRAVSYRSQKSASASHSAPAATGSPRPVRGALNRVERDLSGNDRQHRSRQRVDECAGQQVLGETAERLDCAGERQRQEQPRDHARVRHQMMIGGDWDRCFGFG